MKKTPFTEEHVTAALAKHGLTFRSLVDNYRVNYTCPVHGDLVDNFTHVRADGCRFCVGKRKEGGKHTLKTVIAGLVDLGMNEPKVTIHGFTYNRYGVQNITRIQFTCTEHGEQERDLSAARKSLRDKKRVCTKCASTTVVRRHYTTESFSAAITAANPNYTFKGAHFVQVAMNYPAHCSLPGHGDFTGRGTSLLKGVSCPKCAALKKRASRRKLVDFMCQKDVSI